MYSLKLNKYKNLRILLTNKYLIIVNQNGIIKFKTNFYNIFIDSINKIFYFDLNNYKNIDSNLKYFFINKLYLINNYSSVFLLNYSLNYLNLLFNNLYYNYYNYTLTINLKGIGYKFVIEDNMLKIRVGYSHYINYAMNPDIYFVIKNPTSLTFYSNSKLNIKKIAAFIKLYKKTNLYKGTGIFYDNEFINLKKKNNNNNYILNYLFIGYKYNYLFLNINIFIKMLKNILNLIKDIILNNGDILILYTKNKILNYILQKNCKYTNTYYLNSFTQKQLNLVKILKYFPDLVISFDYRTNAIFLNKLSKYNVPMICITNSLVKNIIQNKMYYLILNNNSLYANLIIMSLIFNTIYNNKIQLGNQFLN